MSGVRPFYGLHEHGCPHPGLTPWAVRQLPGKSEPNDKGSRESLPVRFLRQHLTLKVYPNDTRHDNLMSLATPLIVTAAVIRRSGRILICQRRTNQDHGGKWEFPGGKLEPGEQPRQALLRELREELLIDATIGSKIKCYRYSYPQRKPIRLVFFEVLEFAGEPDYSHFKSVRWVAPKELPRFDFLEGDVEFVKWLAACDEIEAGEP